MRNHRGSALVWAVAAMLILLLISLGLMGASNAYAGRTARHEADRQAYLTARSGLEAVLSAVRSLTQLAPEELPEPLDEDVALSLLLSRLPLGTHTLYFGPEMGSAVVTTAYDDVAGLVSIRSVCERGGVMESVGASLSPAVTVSQGASLGFSNQVFRNFYVGENFNITSGNITLNGCDLIFNNTDFESGQTKFYLDGAHDVFINHRWAYQDPDDPAAYIAADQGYYNQAMGFLAAGQPVPNWLKTSCSSSVHNAANVYGDTDFSSLTLDTTLLDNMTWTDYSTLYSGPNGVLLGGVNYYLDQPDHYNLILSGGRSTTYIYCPAGVSIRLDVTSGFTGVLYVYGAPGSSITLGGKDKVIRGCISGDSVRIDGKGGLTLNYIDPYRDGGAGAGTGGTGEPSVSVSWGGVHYE